MSAPVKVSACLICRDEEHHLPACLDSVRSVVDEIVVIDTGSTDQTVKLAKERGARVDHYPWHDDFSAARNAALERASGDWILVIDADERLESIGYDAFRAPLVDDEKLGFLLTLTNHLEKGDSSVQLLRLFRNRKELRFSGLIHERVDPALLRLARGRTGAVGVHPARIVHHGYMEPVRQEKNKDVRDIRLLKKQLQVDPSDPFYWYKFAAHPHARAHQAEEVSQALCRAWELVQAQDPHGAVFSFTAEIAALYLLETLGQRDYAGLQAVVSRAARINGFSPNLHYALGMARLIALELDQASDHLENALSGDGRLLPYAPFVGVTGHLSLNALSEVRFLQGREVESLDLFQKATGMKGGEPANTFHGDAELLAKACDPRWALDLLTRALQADPSQAALWQRGGSILAALGLADKAKQWLDRSKACKGLSETQRVVQIKKS